MINRETAVELNQESSKNEGVPLQVVQTGLSEVTFEGEKFEPTINSQAVSDLFYYLLRDRNDETLTQKAQIYLNENPLEVRLVKDIRGGIVGGRLYLPEESDNKKLYMALPEFTLQGLYLLQRGKPLPPLLTDIMEAFPHELIHYINYIENPDYHKLVREKVHTRQQHINIGMIGGTICGTLIGGRSTKPFLGSTRRTLLGAALGGAMGLGYVEGLHRAVDPSLYINAHSDTPQLYEDIHVRAKTDDELRRLTLDSFSFRKIDS